MPERVRIHDVAAAAGVSVTTVSHALNGRGKVSDATRRRVQSAAQRLGYLPNRSASTLRRRRSDILGLVSDQIATSPFAGRIISGAQEAASRRGMTLMLVNSEQDPELERREIDVLLAQPVDALLYATMGHRAVKAPRVPATVPLVLVNALAPGRGLPGVVPDEHRLAVTATRVLLEAGHLSVAHITIGAPGPGQHGRAAGYRSVMTGAGLVPHVVVVDRPSADAEAGRVGLLRAMAERPGLTAAFCFNDLMAMGVYQAAHECGLDVPGALSVIGVDDFETVSAQIRPGLTTMALPHRAMGRWAAQEAIRGLDGEPMRQEPLLLDCPLVRRGSVAAATARP